MGLFSWLNETSEEQVLHDKLLVGEVCAGCLSNNDLIALKKFRRWYHPSFTVWDIVDTEMAKRRKDKCGY